MHSMLVLLHHCGCNYLMQERDSFTLPYVSMHAVLRGDLRKVTYRRKLAVTEQVVGEQIQVVQVQLV